MLVDKPCKPQRPLIYKPSKNQIPPVLRLKLTWSQGDQAPWSPSITTEEVLFRPWDIVWSHCSWTGVSGRLLMTSVSVLSLVCVRMFLCRGISRFRRSCLRLFSIPLPSQLKPSIHFSRSSWWHPQEASLGRPD